MVNENTRQGLTLEQAAAQLSASRQQAPEKEQLEDVNEDVVDTEEDYDEDYVEDSDDDSELEEDTEGDEEEDDDPDSEDPDEDSEGEDDEEVFLVPIDGEEVEVSADELVKGYLRQNDYTRKRQADAKAVRDLTSTYETKLNQLDEALQGNVSFEQQQMQAISRQMEQAQDDVTKQNLHYKYLQLQNSLQQRTNQQKQLQQAKQARERAVKESKLKQEIDALRDTFEDWDSRKDVLAGYLKDQGFEDLEMFVDRKLAVLVDKAKQFDDLQQTRESVVKKKLRKKVPKTLKPGGGEKRANADQKKVKSVESRFRQTGSIHDALEYLHTRRGNK